MANEPTDAEIRSILETLLLAMQLEEEGQSFYLAASEHMEERSGRRALLALARGEQQHLQLVQAEYESLSQAGGWLELDEARSGASSKASPAPTLEEVPQRLSLARASDRDLLEQAIEMERRQYQLYRRAAARATEPCARDVYEFLLRQEGWHFIQLQERLERLLDGETWDDDDGDEEKPASFEP